MARIIAIANQKGGVGKTTTNINLAACLAEAGKRVLTVDADPQSNTTSGLGISKKNIVYSIYDIFLGSELIRKSIHDTCVEGLKIIPSCVELAGAEIELIGHEKREFILKDALRTIRDEYDYILIDCPPSLNILTINSLAAADTVLVPIQCEYYALEGLSQLINTINLVRKRLNPELFIEGVVFTMFDARTNLSLQVVDEVKRNISKKVYKAIIPRNVRLSEAPSHGMPITQYDKRSKGAESYTILADIVINGFEMQ